MSAEQQIQDSELQPSRRFFGRPRKNYDKEDFKNSARTNLRTFRANKRIPSDEKWFMSDTDKQNLILTLDFLQIQLDIVKDVLKSYTHKTSVEGSNGEPVTVEKIKKSANVFIQEKFSIKDESSE